MEITTDQTDEKQRSVAILPLLSRIDRLETAMRRLEMKQSSSPSGCSTANTAFSPSSGVTSEHQLPVALDLDVALKETSFKGALLERIKTLENRLFQLRLRVESEKMEARSSRDHHLSSSSCSFPIFMMSDNPNTRKHVIQANPSSMITNTNYLETQHQAILEAKEEEEEGNITSCKEDEESGECKLQKKKKKKSNKDSKNEHEKRRSNKKKKAAMSKAEREKIKSQNWTTHFKILGC
uniref:Uncharacterized protein n=1 Tax=Kalanchoe fedtschenkoi TaxID=63787 RepID=A0A7N0UVM4_KALFE